MDLRKGQLWRLPALTLVGGYIAFCLTVALGRFFFIDQVPGADGVIETSVNQPRYLLFSAVLFLAVFVDGVLLARRMTRREAAVSTGLLVAAAELWLLAGMLISNFPVDAAVLGAQLLCLRDGISTLLMELTDSARLSTALANLWPLLWIPFAGRALPAPAAETIGKEA